MKNNIDGRPGIVAMTIPLFFELLLQICVGLADQYMLAGYDEHCVAAVGNANQIMNMLTLTFNIIGVATIVLVSQYIGAGKTEKAGEIYTLAVFVNIAFSVVISLLLAFGGGAIYTLMGIPSELHDLFITYITTVGSFLFLQATFVVFASIMKSNARMKDTMMIAVIVNIVNVLCNWLLIYGPGPFPELGILGAAIATNLGRFTGMVLVIIAYYKRIKVPLSLKKLRPFPFDMLKRLLKIGVPSAGESVSYNFGQVMIYAIINTFGTDVINTKVYISSVVTFAWLFSLAISQSTQIVIGYYIGAGREEDARKLGWRSSLTAVGFNLAIALAIYFFSNTVIGIFTSNEQILSLAHDVLMIDIFLECGRGLNNVFVRALQGTGDIKFPVGLCIASTWVISVLFAFIFGIVLGWGLKGVWLAMACDEVTRGIIFIFRWKSGKWKKKSLVEKS